MTSTLCAYREHERERERVVDLFALLPRRGGSALDIGARDGYLSKLLAERFERVVALDLEQPRFTHPGVETVQGNAARLQFADASFDCVLCAEVLEHIPVPQLQAACSEIARVTADAAVIGVPFRQDLRQGRTWCARCHRRNPPWGHVNSFDTERLVGLFPSLALGKLSYVGRTKARTNAIAARLMDFAGNPYGTYEQDEPCVHCGASLAPPARRSPAQRVATRAAHWLDRLQTVCARERPNWLHARFEKRRTG
jgi:SAM-dependent methyltransferase